jgi:hypothetical protein
MQKDAAAASENDDQQRPRTVRSPRLRKGRRASPTAGHVA